MVVGAMRGVVDGWFFTPRADPAIGGPGGRLDPP